MSRRLGLRGLGGAGFGLEVSNQSWASSDGIGTLMACSRLVAKVRLRSALVVISANGLGAP